MTQRSTLMRREKTLPPSPEPKARRGSNAVCSGPKVRLERRIAMSAAMRKRVRREFRRVWRPLLLVAPVVLAAGRGLPGDSKLTAAPVVNGALQVPVLEMSAEARAAVDRGSSTWPKPSRKTARWGPVQPAAKRPSWDWPGWPFWRPIAAWREASTATLWRAAEVRPGASPAGRLHRRQWGEHVRACDCACVSH